MRTHTLHMHTLHILIGLLLLHIASAAIAAERPNIVWIVVDDMSSHFGYQGEKLVNTPHVDRLAREGVVFKNAYATAPVCSTFRSAMITGMYQTTIGSHHHPLRLVNQGFTRMFFHRTFPLDPL